MSLDTAIISPGSSPESSRSSSPSPTPTPNESTEVPELIETSNPGKPPHIVSNMAIRRISIAAVWTIFMVMTNATVMLGIAKFITSAAYSVGLFGAFVIITIPVVYAIDPETVSRFKFASLAPSIAVGLYGLDYLANRAVHYIKQKQF